MEISRSYSGGCLANSRRQITTKSLIRYKLFVTNPVFGDFLTELALRDSNIR